MQDMLMTLLCVYVCTCVYKVSSYILKTCHDAKLYITTWKNVLTQSDTETQEVYE